MKKIFFNSLLLMLILSIMPLSCSAVKRCRFTREEDNALVELVKQGNGKVDWKQISIIMQALGYNRTIRQCRERYVSYLSPDINHSAWTTEEDNLLVDLVNRMGTKWAKMKPYFNNRTDINIKHRYHLLMRIKAQSDRTDDVTFDRFENPEGFMDFEEEPMFTDDEDVIKFEF